MSTLTVTPDACKWSFAYGPATTAGVELSGCTAPTTLDELEPVRGMENVLLYDGREVLGIDGLRFPFLTAAVSNLGTVRHMVAFGEEIGKPAKIEVA